MLNDNRKDNNMFFFQIITILSKIKRLLVIFWML